MERPLHNVKDQAHTNSSRMTTVIVVGGIHVLAVALLVYGLASSNVAKKLEDIKATVEKQKTPPKVPPPPPPDTVKPPPPVAIVPVFQVQAEAQSTVQTAPKQVVAPPPPVSAAPRIVAPTKLEPIMKTHVTPPYPTMSLRLGEQGTTSLLVTIDISGNVIEDKILKSSGSDRLDQAALAFVKAHWKWQPPTQEGKPIQTQTPVDVVWNLQDAQ